MTSAIGRAARVLVTPAASPPRLGVALQAGITMALAVGVPAALGRADLGLGPRSRFRHAA